jgi:hypothetical protein
MEPVEYLPIDPDRLDAMRRHGADETGNAWTAFGAAGGEPVRCCLRRTEPGERIALISYSPWTRPHPWAETGPVYVHAERCAGYRGDGAYPAGFARDRSMLSPFDATGARIAERVTFVGPDDDHHAAVRDLLAVPGVEAVHVRSATAGCFTFLARRDGSP